MQLGFAWIATNGVIRNARDAPFVRFHCPGNSIQEYDMYRTRTLTGLLMAGALLAGGASPAFASKADRAAQAIAAAQAKIDSAKTIGAGTEVPRRVAAAQAELARASEAKQSGHNEDAIQIAIHAQAMADAILGETTARKDADVAATRAAAQDQTAAAHSQAEAARAEAAAANARAEAAQQAAQQSAQQAAAATQAAVAAAQTPPPAPEPTKVETTLTTATPATGAHRTVKKKVVVHRKVRGSTHAATVTTATTKVSTGQ
jgi:hypothetical protein